ncbi:MAG TPA: HAD hydrolase family protein [Planctomycetota bacterium]|nr:HAD hydrolase family protein [Planctomycetota bacterium]
MRGRPELLGATDHLARMELLVLDIDGTLTDGQVVYSVEGDVQRYSVHDGQGLVWVTRIGGMKQAWISGRAGSPARRRAKELGVDCLRLGVSGKAQVLQSVQQELGIAPDRTLAMGDDLPDLGLAAHSGLFIAPKNARSEVRQRAHFVTRKRGGHGAVREVCEWLLYAKGHWSGIVEDLVR